MREAQKELSCFYPYFVGDTFIHIEAVMTSFRASLLFFWTIPPLNMKINMKITSSFLFGFIHTLSQILFALLLNLFWRFVVKKHELHCWKGIFLKQRYVCGLPEWEVQVRVWARTEAPYAQPHNDSGKRPLYLHMHGHTPIHTNACTRAHRHKRAHDHLRTSRTNKHRSPLCATPQWFW